MYEIQSQKQGDTVTGPGPVLQLPSGFFRLIMQPSLLQLYCFGSCRFESQQAAVLEQTAVKIHSTLPAGPQTAGGRSE